MLCALRVKSGGGWLGGVVWGICVGQVLAGPTSPFTRGLLSNKRAEPRESGKREREREVGGQHAFVPDAIQSMECIH